MKNFASLVSLSFLLCVAGCKPGDGTSELVRLGDSAPALGAKPLNEFVLGKWTTMDYLDPVFAKQLGVQSLLPDMEEQNNGPINEVYEFKADGSFEFEFVRQKTKVGGTYTIAQNMISLNYTTLNGKPLEQEKARILKEAESGRQGAILTEVITDWLVSAQQKLVTLIVGSDTKLLIFSSSMPEPGASADPTAQLMGTALTRLGPKGK